MKILRTGVNRNGFTINLIQTMRYQVHVNNIRVFGSVSFSEESANEKFDHTFAYYPFHPTHFTPDNFLYKTMSGDFFYAGTAMPIDIDSTDVLYDFKTVNSKVLTQVKNLVVTNEFDNVKLAVTIVRELFDLK